MQDARQPSFLRRGGWLVLVGLVVITGLFAWHVATRLAARRPGGPVGTDLAAYGFTLEPSTVAREDLVASGLPKDGLPVLTDPQAWKPERLTSGSRRLRKLLLPSDPVVALVVNGEARAWPLRLLAWHEAVNDTLGDQPILVTYHPLAGSVGVFSRRVRDDVLTFGFSGLMLDSLPLLYDRRDRPNEESLWCQLTPGAAVGPASGTPLQPLPAVISTWGAWLEAFPDTTVLAPTDELLTQYAREPYGSYLGSDLLRFPVEPLPADDMPLKTPVLVARLSDAWHAFPYPAIAQGAGADGVWRLERDGQPFQILYHDRPPRAVLADPAGHALPSLTAFYFAWYARHAGDTVWEGTAIVDR